ncbi:glycerophosphodiester phosphodiesterase [Paraglaciecola chathamensis]|uniref:Glycerophosphoryl diester phosphodiesterase n=1 Tax=Paraglaciecola chathamensis TaxID=368405 RepID=A0A8H9I7H8_9ALTE|nr:glycerophosphodiester phosphodiesterase family protein [Paraglaciecola oceanifecundans]GGZ47837.1 glycerophosphoryl diester phosphodiesterase [Paraglaciecola oceanifecundans]
MLVFAHRGASADAPENTLLAIKAALTQGCDGIEIDVHQHGDKLVVIHDHWLHRTTNGTGQLKDHSFEALKQLNAGSDERIPTLWQVMECIAGRCLLNIEIKGVSDVQLVLDNIEKAIHELNFTLDHFIVSSFDHHLLRSIKAHNPDLKIGALTASKPIEYAAFAQALNAYSVNADVSFVDEAFVRDAKQRGLKFFVYTVDQPADLATLASWQVDGVFSNGPGKAKAFLAM